MDMNSNVVSDPNPGAQPAAMPFASQNALAAVAKPVGPQLPPLTGAEAYTNPNGGVPVFDPLTGGATIPGTSSTQGITPIDAAAQVKAALAAGTSTDPSIQRFLADTTANKTSGTINPTQVAAGPKAMGPGGIPLY
jgi:hypothetical protein